MPAPKRRGRKPGNQPRSVRESQRKINHSLIEKARRSKINDALGALKELVPSDYGRARTKDSEDLNGKSCASALRLVEPNLLMLNYSIRRN